MSIVQILPVQLKEKGNIVWKFIEHFQLRKKRDIFSILTIQAKASPWHIDITLHSMN